MNRNEVPELVGLSEAAELLGLSKPAASRRARASDFPKPVAELGCGPVWTLEQIREYARDRSLRFHERAGVVACASASSPPRAAGTSTVSLEEAAETLGVSVALLREAATRPGMPLARDPTGRVVGIPTHALGVYGRTLATRRVETTAKPEFVL